MGKVKLSVNASLDKCEILSKLGYSYIEPSNTDIMKMSPSDFKKAVEKVKESKLQCEVIDNPIPCAEDFSDEQWDIRKWYSYLKLSAVRAKLLGAKYWCIGNGTSRRVSEQNRNAIVNYYEVIETCAEIGEDYGIKVIVEPLGPSVTNYLNSVEEVIDFLAEIGRKDVFTMVDYRWEFEQNRPGEDLYKYSSRIAHAHIDNPKTDYINEKIRKVPTLDDEVDYDSFFDFIKSDSFSGIMSIEANTFDDYETDLGKAMKLYKEKGLI